MKLYVVPCLSRHSVHLSDGNLDAMKNYCIELTAFQIWSLTVV